MKDWKAIAQAYGLPLSSADLDRVALPLSGLEESLQPLLKDLPAGLEPDPELHLAGGDE
jgi:hypothetical protein